jgi:hypothetical protein
MIRQWRLGKDNGEPLMPARNTAARLGPATQGGGWPQLMAVAHG